MSEVQHRESRQKSQVGFNTDDDGDDDDDDDGGGGDGDDDCDDDNDEDNDDVDETRSAVSDPKASWPSRNPDKAG